MPHFTKPILTDSELEALLKKAAAHVLTPAERWDQSVSFVYGQLAIDDDSVTREQVVARITEIRGPRPEEE
jgi:hypothetical protein